MSIPKIIHFILGLDSDHGNKRFGFAHFMAIYSAINACPKYQCNLYLKYEPDGPYWELIRRHVNVIKVEPPTQIFGNPIEHFAHKADVLRLEILAADGGIYLDIDTICQRNFDPLLEYPAVMGLELAGEANAAQVTGLCNATMMASPGCPFIKEWYSMYRTFDRNNWNFHSVRLPYELAQALGEPAIHVEPPGSFFWPSWDDGGIDMLFFQNLSFPEAFSFHLWESRSWRFIENLNANQVLEFDTTYNRVARKYVNLNSTVMAELVQLATRPIEVDRSKLNLGCGANRLTGWINVDVSPYCSPDLLFDIEHDDWPLPDNSIEQVRAWHIFEHIGDGFSHVLKELYRVCRHGAKIDVKVPHPNHDWFVMDPTHIRRFHAETFSMFDRQACIGRMRNADSRSAIALMWEIDFVTEAVTMTIDAEARKITASDKDIVRLARYQNNIFSEIHVMLRARKASASAPRAAVTTNGNGRGGDRADEATPKSGVDR